MENSIIYNYGDEFVKNNPDQIFSLKLEKNALNEIDLSTLCNLEYLETSDEFDSKLIVPKGLKELILGKKFNQLIELPQGLIIFELKNQYYSHSQKINFPNTLVNMFFNPGFTCTCYLASMKFYADRNILKHLTNLKILKTKDIISELEPLNKIKPFELPPSLEILILWQNIIIDSFDGFYFVKNNNLKLIYSKKRVYCKNPENLLIIVEDINKKANFFQFDIKYPNSDSSELLILKNAQQNGIHHKSKRVVNDKEELIEDVLEIIGNHTGYEFEFEDLHIAGS